MNNENNFKKLTPFKMQVLQSFPFIDEDFDAITNYELLCKVVEYLNKTVDNVNLLETDFQTLYNYVHDYFDNLDVQNEINTKLDEMAEDGTLTNLIERYINPLFEAQNRIIESQNNNIATINNQVVQIDNKVNRALGNTPIPVASVDDMTDTTKVYLLTTNGHWYYYNDTTSTWTDGGVYQATQIGTNAVNITNLDTTLQKAQGLIIPYFDRSDYTAGKFIDFNNPTGEFGNYGSLCVTNFIEINKNYKTLYINFKNQNIGRVSCNFYDSNYNFISNTPYITNMDSNFVVTCVIPANAKYVKATVLTSHINDADLIFYEDLANMLNTTNINLSDLQDQVDNYILENNAKYIKDLRCVVDYDFKQHNNNFAIDSNYNIDYSTGVASGTGYGKIIYSKFVESDICKNSCEFIYTTANLKLGISIGRMMGLLQTDLNTLSLHNNYDSTDVIPAVTESASINSLTIGHKYCLEFVKIGMRYEINLIDLNTLEKQQCVIPYLKNTGFGRSQVNLFSGSVDIYNYKYFLPYFNDNAEILFLGDSTTEGVDVQDLTKRWCYQLKINYLKGRNCIINGVGGNNCYQSYSRLERVLNSNGYNNLKYAIIYLGLNGSLTDYSTYMPQIVNLCIQHNIKPIVCIPQLYNAEVGQKRDFAISQNWDLIRFDLTGLTMLHPTDSNQPLLEEYAIKSLNYLM